MCGGMRSVSEHSGTWLDLVPAEERAVVSGSLAPSTQLLNRRELVTCSKASSDLIVAFVAAERELLAPLGLSVSQLWRGVERASERLCEPPLTLCHGDCHIGNTYQLRVKPS